MSSRHLRDALTVLHTPHHVSPIIQACSLVDYPLILGRPELERLPLITVADDFTCLEEWSVPSRARGVGRSAHHG
jgi:hypothetical protein